MNDDKNVGENQIQNEFGRSLPTVVLAQDFLEALETLEASLQTLAQDHEGDAIALLALLRRLEATHIHIRDTLFQAALPNNRQRLYALLKDIEVEGGWPYIPRMKLQR